MRGFALLLAAGTALLVLEGCQTPAVEQTRAEPPGVAISSPAYQPDIHAVLALNGGYGTIKSAGPLITQWRREGSGESFSLTLSPDVAAVQALTPGVYDLVSATSGGKDVLGEGAAGVSAITLEPGDVVYAGRLMMREVTVKSKSKDKPKTRLAIEVGNTTDIGRNGIQLNYPSVVERMKVKLLKLTKS